MENICAFVTADNICLKPPTGWAKQYKNLQKQKSRKTPEGINRLLYSVKLPIKS